jgi:flagellar protein FlaJ
MNLGLDNKQIWDKFIGESGSNLIYKYLNIYLDTVTLGGPAEPIGKVVGSSVLEQTLLREKKDMHAKSFFILLIPMHAAMIGIFVGLYQIMVVLTGSVSKMMTTFQQTSVAASGSAGGAASGAGVSAGSAMGGMTMLTNFPEKEMMTFVVIILTIITVSNIFAARIVGGGDRYMYYFYIAIFCTCTGLVLLVAPMVVGMFFNPEALQHMGSAVK